MTAGDCEELPLVGRCTADAVCKLADVTRAAIYLRISQDRTGEELGVARQREACKTLAERRGWEIFEVYCENDTSASGKRRRPEWERMMAAVEAGQVQVVVGWTIDRTLRSGRDRLRMLESGKEHGITISLVRGSDMDLSTPSGRLAADILGAVALAEIEIKADRQRSANEQAARQGRRVGGRRPFGYLLDGMTLVPAEADAVAKAFDDYLSGISIIAISRRWNEAGLFSGVVNPQTGKATQWDHSGVRAVLRNPRYYGMRAHNGEVVGRAQWPAIVSEPTWRAVNAILTSSAAEHKPHGGRRLLTSIAICAVCESQIISGGNKAGKPPGYRCPEGHVSRRGDQVDEQIEALALGRLSSPDVIRRLNEAAAADDGTTELVAEAERLRTEMDTFARERAQRIITPAQFSIMNSEVKAQLADVERRMAMKRRPSGLLKLVGKGLTAEQWGDLDVDDQRMIVSGLMAVRLWSGGRGVRVPATDCVQVRWTGTSIWVPKRAD